MKNLLKSGITGIALTACAILISCSPQKPPAPPELPPIEIPTEMTTNLRENGDVFLRWKNNTLSTGYEVKVVPAEDATAENFYPVSTHYATIPKKALEYSTTYLWSVRTLIDDRTSDWSANGAFSTKDKPAAEEFLGNWLVDREDIESTATIAGNNILLSELLPDRTGTDETTTFAITEFTDENGDVVDNKVYVEMGDLSSYLPVTDFEKLPLDVKSDKTLFGTSGQMETVTQEFDPPVALSDVEGLSEYLDAMMADNPLAGQINLDNIRFTSVSVLVNSVVITANFPDPKDTSVLQFKILITATIGFKTTDGMLEQIMMFLPSNMTRMSIETVVDSKRQE